MTGLPRVEVNPQDFGIGSVPGNGEGVHVKIGVATILAAGNLVTVTSPQGAKELIGGKLGEAAALAFGEGTQAVICLAVNPSVAGVAGAVTKTGTGTATLSLSGSPNDDYRLRIRITRAAANLAAATAAFQYSLDNGNTYSPEIAVPVSGSYVIPDTGLTLTWADGTFVVGDEYTATCTAPGYTTTDLVNALNTLFARTELSYRFIHVVGAGSATVAAALNTVLEARAADANNPRFIHALMDTADDTDNNLITAFSSFTSVRVGASGGYADVISPITGLVMKRPAAWVIAGRYSGRPVEEHPGRYASGALRTVVRLHRNESVTPGLDAARFATLRTIEGGFYITRGRLFAPPGSDYEQVQNREVMDVACETAYRAWLRWLNEQIQVSAQTGRILEREALRIEAYVEGLVRTALRGKISIDEITDQPAAYVRIDRSENILSTKTIPYDISIVPLGYAERITGKVRFFNPQLQPVA
uniref:Phage tail protein n=1 Tax=Meiothermus ruber TaxID=277 RepID=A0A7C3DQY0_MEIRU